MTTLKQPGIIDKLFNDAPPSNTTESTTQILFEQYRLYIQMMDKVSERRHQANSFFLTVNTIVIAALTTLISIQQPGIQSGWIVVAALAGIVFSVAWHRLIRSYRELNSGKFKIIHLLETRLPARPFDAEWDTLNRGDGSVYTPFAGTEMIVPIIFALLYGTLAALITIGIFR